MPSDLPSDPSRRGALKCLAFGGVGTVFVLSGGILTPVELALAASAKDSSMAAWRAAVPADQRHPHRLQQGSQSGRGGHAQADHRLRQRDAGQAGIDDPHGRHHASVQAGSSSISRPSCCRGLNITELHTVPGEHDVTDGPGTEYFNRFGQGVGQQGLLQLRPQRRALYRSGQRDAFQAERPGRAGRRPACVARKTT